MPVACPCCRASNDAGPACRRCKADLSLLFALEDRRAFLLAEAGRRAAGGDAHAAVAAAGEAGWLRPGDDARRARAAALLLAGDYPAALAAYHELASREA